MPIFGNHTNYEVRRKIRLFLRRGVTLTNLKAALRRWKLRLENGNARMGSTKKRQASQSEQLRRTRRRLRKSERELANLRSKITEDEHLRTRQVFEMIQTNNSDVQEAPPFFIIGPPKSGTSWLVRTLNTHPEILCVSEGKFFGRDFKPVSPYLQWGPELVLELENDSASKGGGWPSLYNTLAQSNDLKTWLQMNNHWIKSEDANLHIKSLTRTATDYFLSTIRDSSGKKIVGDKTPYHIQYLDEIYELYPDAHIVHIIRDGRDQAVSSVFYWWAWARDKGKVFPLSPETQRKRDAYYEDRDTFGPEKLSIFDEASLRGLARSWSNHVGKAIDLGPRFFEDRYFEVKYEDLLTNPETFFGEMAHFLGANSDSGTIEDCVNQTSFEKSSGNRPRGEEDPSSFYRKGIAGDWKNYFTERDKQIFKEEAGDLLIQLGYEKDYNW